MLIFAKWPIGRKNRKKSNRFEFFYKIMHFYVTSYRFFDNINTIAVEFIVGDE